MAWIYLCGAGAILLQFILSEFVEKTWVKIVILILLIGAFCTVTWIQEKDAKKTRRQQREQIGSFKTSFEESEKENKDLIRENKRLLEMQIEPLEREFPGGFVIFDERDGEWIARDIANSNQILGSIKAKVEFIDELRARILINEEALHYLERAGLIHITIKGSEAITFIDFEQEGKYHKTGLQIIGYSEGKPDYKTIDSLGYDPNTERLYPLIMPITRNPGSFVFGLAPLSTENWVSVKKRENSIRMKYFPGSSIQRSFHNIYIDSADEFIISR